MSRALAFVLVGFATTVIACAAPDSPAGETNQAFSGTNGDCKDPSDKSCGPTTKPPVPAPQCFAGLLTAGNACFPASAWSQIAATACATQGAKLQSTALGPACGPQPKDPTTNGADDKNVDAKQGSSSSVNYTCCAAPQTEPPDQCIWFPLDATTNTDPQGKNICTLKNLSLKSVEADKDGVKHAVCCPVPPQPAPATCSTIKVDPQINVACVDKLTVEERAKDICAAQQRTLSTVGTQPCTATKDGLILESVTCCDPNVGGPTPPQGK